MVQDHSIIVIFEGATETDSAGIVNFTFVWKRFQKVVSFFSNLGVLFQSSCYFLCWLVT